MKVEEIKPTKLCGIDLFLRWKFGAIDPMRSISEQLQLCATDGSKVIKTFIELRNDPERQIDETIKFLLELREFIKEQIKLSKLSEAQEEI
jgi:hypothetical protein